jgi:serine/threonine-protein kinase
VGDVLSGRYRLEEKVGEGGMGAVFTAHDTELDRKVAVKLLAASLVNDPEVLERFEREARLTAKLDHPNIVPIYDVGRHEGRPFIVMKLLQGDSLAGLLRARGGFTADETLRLVRQLAAGLDHIHQQGFIHRDVKAGNIMVAPDGHATILDFGILRTKDGGSAITRAGMVMGTPHYMAPEQALGLKDVDHRVDLYALAVVLFECLTGTLPFEAESELQLIQLQAHAPPPEILDRAPWIPRPVAAVMRRALAKRPEERFNSGAELVAALEAAYAEAKASHPQAMTRPAPPGLVPAAPPKTSPSRRRMMESRSALRAVPEPPPPAPGRRLLVAGGLALLAVVVGVGWWLGLPPLTEVRGASVDAGLLEPVEAGVALVLAVDPPEGDAGEAVVALDAPEWLDAGVEDSPDAGTQAQVEPVRPPPGKRRGKVNVITTHQGEPWWAQVSIDGVPRGRTPLLLELPVGRYQVRVERPGFRAQQRQVTVASGKSVVVKLELVP